MTLTSSLFSAVSGLTSQGGVLGVIGDNIANISTVGFKQGNTTFSSLVTGTGSATNGSGATAGTRLEIDQQGLIQTTGISTDVAISGQGFFVIKDDPDAGEGSYLYTRAGSFRQDNQGNFINAAGYYLQAYPLDNNGLLPGEIGNLNTTSSQLLESLETVNTRDISGLAFATTSISLGLNLDADQTILTGAGDTLEPVSTENEGTASTDVLAITADLDVGDNLDVDLGDGTNYNFIYGGIARSDDITANAIFGASTTSTRFSESAVAGPNYLQDGDAFTITTASAGTVTFTFNVSAANADLGTYNSLDTLAEAIDANAFLNASIVDNRLYIAPVDAREAMTFADVATGTLVAQDALDQVDADWADTAAVATNRFATLSGLASLVNDEDGISASIESAASDASVTITVDDPLETIEFSDGGGGGDVISEFGFPAQVAQGLGTPLDPVYDAAGVAGANMASGDISPAFSRNIRIFDSLGVGHDLRVSFVKAGNNEWLVEVFAADENEIVTSNPNGQLASGTILFNGDGSLRNVSSGLSGDISVVWANDAQASTITLDLGTAGSPAGTTGAAAIGLTDGLSQFAGAYNVQFAEQNGAGSGLLSSIEINEEGFVIANFTNGESRRVFKVALASFPNVNGLSPRAGNAFAQSDASGEFSLNEVGDSGVGVISVEALEGANVELADELTKLIVAQRAFQANTKIITTADELLEELNRI